MPDNPLLTQHHPVDLTQLNSESYWTEQLHKCMEEGRLTDAYACMDQIESLQQQVEPGQYLNLNIWRPDARAYMSDTEYDLWQDTCGQLQQA